jgi:PPOX class probable F420-dependent enzyme
MTLEEARRRFAAARVARLATVRPGGAPHAVPVAFAVEADRVAFAVDDKPKRTADLQRLRNIAAEPRVCLLVDHYDDRWAALWWVRADGRAHVEDDDGRRRRALDALARKYEPYRARPPTGAVVIVDVDGWRSWSAS